MKKRPVSVLANCWLSSMLPPAATTAPLIACTMPGPSTQLSVSTHSVVVPIRSRLADRDGPPHPGVEGLVGCGGRDWRTGGRPPGSDARNRAHRMRPLAWAADPGNINEGDASVEPVRILQRAHRGRRSRDRRSPAAGARASALDARDDREREL